MKARYLRFVPAGLVLLALAGPLLAQQGQNQPLYDPNDPIGRVLPPNIHFLVDVSSSMSCIPNDPDPNCNDGDLLGWFSGSKINLTKKAMNTLLSSNLGVRWSLWQYCAKTNTTRDTWSNVKGSYTYAGKPTGLSGSLPWPYYGTYDTYIWGMAYSEKAKNCDRVLGSIAHVSGTTPTTDPDPDQWFKTCLDGGAYDNRASLKLWLDMNFNRTTGTIACGSQSDPFLTEFVAYGNTPIAISLQSILRYVYGKNIYACTIYPYNQPADQKPYYYDPASDSRKTMAYTEMELDKTYGKCRLNAVLLLTDGVNTSGPEGSVGTTELYTKYGIPTYVVGFSMQSAGDRQTLNNMAKAGGTGSAYFAENEQTLLDKLKEALSNIGTDISGDTEPILGFVPPTARSWPTTMPADVKLQNVVYKPSITFMPIMKGHLRAFQAITSNADGNKITFLTDFSKESPYLLWDAADLIKSAGGASRNIYYIDDSNNLQAFTTTNRSKIETLAGLKALKLTNDQLDAFINYIRGQQLGAITYSTPVFVGPPNVETFATTDYLEWVSSDAMKNRCPMIIMGANDGMLHCFSGVDGKEIWAIIPHAAIAASDSGGPCKLYAELYGAGDPTKQGQPNVYGPREYNRRPHYYYVASSPRVANLRTGDSKPAWKTVVVFGLGAGGHEYTCLDVTQAIGTLSSSATFVEPTVRWRYSGESTKPLGETWSVPAIGQFGPINGTYPHGRWLTAFGSGFNLTPPANKDMGKTVYFLDLWTGDKIKQFDLNDTTVTAFGTTKYKLVSTVGNCIFAPVTFYDSAYDSDMLVDRAYFGDYAGKLYRIAVDGSNPASSTVSLFFTDKNGTPIYNGPDIAEHYVSGVGRQTVISFSEYGSPIDEAATPVATTRKAGVMYCMVEETCLAGSNTISDLKPSSGSSSAFKLDGLMKGFYFELPSASEGETALFRPSLFSAEVNGSMVFWMGGTSYKFFPNAVAGVSCDPKNHTANAGKSTAYVFNLSTGAYFPNGQPAELGISGTFYGRASSFHKGARGEGWVDVGTGEMKGFNYDATTNSFSEFGANNRTALMNPTSGVVVLNQYWRELR